MANDELKKHISELQQQMEASAIDGEDRNLLGHLMSDMVKIAQGEPSPDPENAPAAKRLLEQQPGFAETLERQAGDFEQQHPNIANILRQVADLLGKMGI